MKSIVSMIRSLICIIFVVLSPILVASHLQKNEHEKPDSSPELSKSSKESKVSRTSENNESMATVDENGRAGEGSSTALNKFLDDVLNARNDLVWTDDGVGRDGNRDVLRKSKSRRKRGYRQIYGDENIPEFFRELKDNDRTIKRGILDDGNGINGENVHPSFLYDKETSNDQQAKDRSRTKDLCSLSDWLNSEKNDEPRAVKSEDPWARDYESNSFDSGLEANGKTDGRFNARNQRDETKKEKAQSLESLKETILELKKSLNEDDRKQQENSKNLDDGKVGEKGGNQENQGERKVRSKNKHRKNERNDEASLGWWENSVPESLDLKKREQSPEALDEKNARLKVWRTKRTEVNNDDGNPKLFHRAGFGEPYLEGTNLKEFRDRKRRSKGTPSDEKRRSNEPGDKNNLDTDEKNSITITEASSCIDRDTSGKKELLSNNLHGTGPFDRQNSFTNNPTNTKDSGVSKAFREESKSPQENRNFGQLDFLRGKANVVENQLKSDEERDKNRDPNLLGSFEPIDNKLQAASSTETTKLDRDGKEEIVGETRMQKSEESRGNVDLGKEGQVIKLFQPQRHVYQNSERSEKDGEVEVDKELGKISQLPEEKRVGSDLGNVNIVLKSENKNVIKFSNAGRNENSFKDEQPPFVLNMFDVKKKMLMEDADKPGKSISTLYNVKIEKAQVDTPLKGEENCENRDIPFSKEPLDFGKNKIKEELRDDTAEAEIDTRRRNANEGQYKNAIEFDRGLEQGRANEITQNWLRDPGPLEIEINSNPDKTQKYSDLNEKNKYRKEMERDGLDDTKGKVESIQDTNDKLDPKVENDKIENKRKYTEIFIMPDGLSDRIINDRYSHRRILQYMEYSNDDVEDADLNYSDKEEKENQREIDTEGIGNDASMQRKGRTSYNDNKKAKINVMIHEKVQHRKGGRNRKIRNPSVIEYYDYDSDTDQQDHEALLPRSEQDRNKNAYEDRNAVEFDAGFENQQGSRTCIPPAEKKNEHKEAILKEEKENKKFKDKAPKQEFISVEASGEKNATSKTVMPNSSATLLATSFEGKKEGLPGRQESGSRFQEMIEQTKDKFLDRDTKGRVSNPIKCNLILEKNLDPSGIDNFPEEIQSVNAKNEKIYEWKENETKDKPRIKGDQRMYHGAKDKLDLSNRVGESLRDQVENPESRGSTETSGKLEIGVKLYPAVSSSDRPLESFATSNVSQSNYFALKSTDDMFKGGPEQNNNTVGKLRGSNAIGKVVEWKTQEVNGVKNEAIPEKDAVSWSLTDRRQYIDTDSRSPYENRKYLEAQFPREREPVQNIDREKQTVISSWDLHESFVEPLDWIDDFDEDIRVRLGRSLKTIETNTGTYVGPNETTYGNYATNGYTEIVSAANYTNSTSSVDLQKLFEGSERVKRDILSHYDTFYDDTNQYRRNSEGTGFDQRLENPVGGNNFQFLNPYENLDNRNVFHFKDNLKGYDNAGGYEDNYDKVVRSRDAKKERRLRSKERLLERKLKKRKGKGSKSKNSRRKHRHRKKHSKDSKSKNRDNKKHKKQTSKHVHHRSVKKSKTSDSEEKIREDHQESSKKKRDKAMNQNTANSENEVLRNGIASLLIADNMEDESQMDSALHGELAEKIVKQIFDQVQKDGDLNASLGPGLYRKHKARDTLADKSHSQTTDNDQMKHTEQLLTEILQLLDRLIYDAVQKKTCMSLPPDTMEFLIWMLDVKPQNNSLEQLRTLPLTQERDSEDVPKDKFLFKKFPNRNMEKDIDELYRKVRLIKHLIKEYNELPDKDKKMIQYIQDFLAKQLDLLLEYIEAKQEAEKKGKLSSPSGATKGKGGRILQPEIDISNASSGSHSTRLDAFSPLINTPKVLKLGNVNFLTDEELLRDRSSIDVSHRGRRIIRSVDKRSAHNNKQGKHKKRRRKHGKGHKGASATDQSRHKGSGHKGAAHRQKREYLDEVFWDSADSGYEQPLIYTSMDIPLLEFDGNDGEISRNEGNSKDTDARSLEEKERSELKSNNDMDARLVTESDEDALKELARNQNREKNANNSLEDEEPITGKNEVEDEILLLNKRQAWKQKNEQELEEVAFGQDMRNAQLEKMLFEKLTEIDKRRNDAKESAMQEKMCNASDCNTSTGNSSNALSDEEKLRMLEKKINVYADND